MCPNLIKAFKKSVSAPLVLFTLLSPASYAQSSQPEVTIIKGQVDCIESVAEKSFGSVPFAYESSSKITMNDNTIEGFYIIEGNTYDYTMISMAEGEPINTIISIAEHPQTLPYEELLSTDYDPGEMTKFSFNIDNYGQVSFLEYSDTTAFPSTNEKHNGTVKTLINNMRMCLGGAS